MKTSPGIAAKMFRVLADEGVDTIFGYSGGAILPKSGCVFVSVKESDKPWIVEPVRLLLARVPKWWEQLWDKVDPQVHIAASEWLFGKLVKSTYRRGVVYPVPMSVSDLHELAKTGQ